MLKKIISIFMMIAVTIQFCNVIFANEKAQPIYHLTWDLKEDDAAPPKNTDCKITFSNDVVIQPTSEFCFFMWNGNLETSDVVLMENNRSLVKMEVLEKN